jgi:hypothetical protein
MAIASTHDLITSYTVPSDTADVTLSSIPQTYTDLYLVVMGKSSYTGDAGNGFRIQFNGVTTSSYSWIDQRLMTTGTKPIGIAVNSDTYMQFIYLPSSGGGTPSTTWGSGTVEISNYTNTSYHKSALGRSFSREAAVGMANAIFRNTSAVTSLRWFGDGNILAGSTIHLYGVRAA